MAEEKDPFEVFTPEEQEILYQFGQSPAWPLFRRVIRRIQACDAETALDSAAQKGSIARAQGSHASLSSLVETVEGTLKAVHDRREQLAKEAKPGATERQA